VTEEEKEELKADAKEAALEKYGSEEKDLAIMVDVARNMLEIIASIMEERNLI